MFSSSSASRQRHEMGLLRDLLGAGREKNEEVATQANLHDFQGNDDLSRGPVLLSLTLVLNSKCQNIYIFSFSLSIRSAGRKMLVMEEKRSIEMMLFL